MTNTNCFVYSIKTPDDGQYICQKHVEFFIKNNLEKECISLVFIIRINQQMHIYEHVQSHFSITHQPVSLNYRTHLCRSEE